MNTKGNSNKKTKKTVGAGLVISGMKSENAERKKFQAALDNLNKLKSEMAHLREFQLWATSEFYKTMPEVEESYWQARKEQIFFYDAFLNENRKKVSKKMVENIEDVLFHDIDEVGTRIDYEGLEELKKKYENKEGIEAERVSKLEKAAEFSQNFGFEIDPEDVALTNSPKGMMDFYEKYKEQIHEAQKKFAEENKNSKSKKDEKAEALLNTDISKLFKQLVVEIHPDHETDETIRKQKEILMKELTAARDNQDILELLKIKNKIEAMLDKATDDIDNKTIKRFIKLIKSQCSDLKEGLAVVSDNVPYGDLMRYSKNLAGDKKKYLELLKSAKNMFTNKTEEVNLDMHRIKENPKLMDTHIHKRQDLIIREILHELYS